jgi:hypothetical protein
MFIQRLKKMLDTKENLIGLPEEEWKKLIQD